MGMLRVAASIGTMGAVSPRSRASRDTRAIMRESKKQTELLARIADPAAYERREAKRQSYQDAAARNKAKPASMASLLAMYAIFAVFAIFVTAALVINYGS